MGSKIKVLLAALISTPLAAQDYNPTIMPPQLLGSPQTMMPLNGGDDSTRRVQFSFPFEYYGQTFTSAWVSSNGFVSFYGPHNLCCDGLQMQYAQRNTIYAYWTDLIGGANPYYRMTDTSVLFGWYGTNEYGTQNKSTFEINLSSDGKIQINYGAVANTYHTVSAGLTGPTSSDNVQLFYGTNVQNLSFQSGLLSPIAPEPTFSPVSVAPTPAPTPVPNPLAAPIEQAVMTADETEQVEAVTAEIQSAIEAQASAEPTAETAVGQEEDDSKAEDATAPPPPPGLLSGGPPSENTIVVFVARKDKNTEFFQGEAVEDADTFLRETVLQAAAQDVAFVAQADAQYVQQYGEQTTTETSGATYSLQPTEGPTFAAAPATGMGDMTTPVGQAQQMELLGMQADMAAGEPKDIGDVNDSDKDVMAQLAAIPEGYGAYTQARIPDMPFYKPRDIYKGRRIPDQNMALYRLMSGQDARWQQMTDEQYER
jgi:hypothetical protein